MPACEGGGQTVEYEVVVRAIARVANTMRPREKLVVLACLWRAGVHPAGFIPDYDEEPERHAAQRQERE